jgi:hypothetical protein
METALELEKKVNQSLLDLHKVADSHGDFQVRRTPDHLKKACGSSLKLSVAVHRCLIEEVDVWMCALS